MSDSNNDTVVGNSQRNASLIQSTASSVTVDFPIFSPGTLPTILELSPSFCITVAADEAQYEADTVASQRSFMSTSPADILQTAMDDVMAAAALFGVDHPIRQQFYVQPLFSMLSACVTIEEVKVPECWAAYVDNGIFGDLECVVITEPEEV